MSGFKWTKRKRNAAEMFTAGYTTIEVSQEMGISERQLYRWKADIIFAAELDGMSNVWTKPKSEAAVKFAEGYTVKDVSQALEIPERQLNYWKANVNFSAEVDKLCNMVGVASRAYRLRIIQQVVREKAGEYGKPKTEKDLLEWLKLAQSETDGIKLDLTAILDAYASLAGGRPGGTADPQTES